MIIAAAMRDYTTRAKALGFPVEYHDDRALPDNQRMKICADAIRELDRLEKSIDIQS